MLDNETKRRIDTARDILVGKVPDPKSQVEQITIALIYKFMDDMDLEAEELGGHSNFFTGEYEKYGWRKIFDPALGGHEMLGLYGDAITRMALNPNLPQLFRDIFKNAYLPYRDPETLKSFLKIIDDFNYDHSEKLGDAFEYLLSVLGSQGDAGQFRTPRHIIDFMTAILNPRKTDTILDPACGTAGFLISAYKHILRQHGELKNDDFVGSLHTTTPRLTPDDRTRITSNIRGYDISPDMVRLSLVNLYLHGFPEPHIYEYDSLTSEDRWNEFYDVILANPPFMSPKGGIRPHKRFSVQSNRSEVLFVDLMAEHLTPGGRAAIVVPEGIIFQSGTAYKSLRKMLVDDYLVGVISLPAGIFNPYAGVKTSILWLDKSLARKTDQILFAKITADGFDLGAQRRPVKQNDLPGAFRAIQQYIEFLQTGSMPSGPIHDDNFVRSLHDNDSVRSLHATTPESTLQSIYPHITLVAKSAIAENGDYNLSGERYKIVANSNSDYQIYQLSDLCEIYGGGTPSKTQEEYWKDGNVKWISSRHINDKGVIIGNDWITESGLKNSSSKIAPKDSIIFITRVSVGKYAIADDDYAINQDLTVLIAKNNTILHYKYLYAIAKNIAQIIDKNAVGIGVRGVNREFLSKIQIPLPPLSIQQEIVTEIEAYQKVIDGARQVVENYQPRITINPDWESKELQTVSNIISGYSFDSKDFSKENSVKCIKITNVGVREFIEDTDELLPEKFVETQKNFTVKEGDIVISLTRTIISSGLKVARVPLSWDNALVNQRVAAIKSNSQANLTYIYLYLCTDTVFKYIEEKSRSLMQPNLSINDLKKLQIPLPPLETQLKIVEQIEREQELVNANKELIALFEQKIKDRIARVWGEDAPKAYPEPTEEYNQVAEPDI